MVNGGRSPFNAACVDPTVLTLAQVLCCDRFRVTVVGAQEAPWVVQKV